MFDVNLGLDLELEWEVGSGVRAFFVDLFS